MNTPRVLLLTGTQPGDGGVGQIYLRDLCLHYPPGNLSCFVVFGAGYTRPGGTLADLPTEAVEWAHDKGWRPVSGYPGSMFSLFASQYARLVQSTQVLGKIVGFAQRHRVDLIWAVLSKPIIYRLAFSVSQQMGVPLVTTVWDPPERLVVEDRLDRISRRYALDDFAQAQRLAVRCGVMSEQMKNEYESQYGVTSYIVRHGVRAEECKTPRPRPNDNGMVTIGFAGSLYAQFEWNALLHALASVEWRLMGKDVVVRVLGPNMPISTSGRANIQYLGWRPVSEVVELLAECDVNYLPYWFDPAYRISVQLCFPSKMSAYLASARPVFYHGPEDSSPARFLMKYPAGLSCHSLEAKDIVAKLEMILNDDVAYAHMSEASHEAALQQFNLNVFLQQFAGLIGIKVEHLRQPV